MTLRLRALVALAAVLALGGAATGPPGAAPAHAATPPASAAARARPPRPPRLHAAAAILVEPQTGDVVLARRADQERPIASTTKLMTALLSVERLPLGRRVRAASYPAAAGESLLGLRPGERLTVRDLLRALLLPSANDAAVTLADAVAGGEARFVAAMNARARALGLAHTHYANPVGLDAPGSFSTARDLVRLAGVLLRHPFAARTVDLPRATLRSGVRSRLVVNRNDLVARVAWVDGVKTGHTRRAGYVLVGAARRHGVRLLSAVLGEPSVALRDGDTLALLRYGLARYVDATPLRRGRVLAHAALQDAGAGQQVALVAGASAHAVVRRGERAGVRLVGAPRQLAGPLPAGARVGRALVVVRGRVVGRVPLVTARAVPRSTFAQRVSARLDRPRTVGLAIAVLAGSLPVALWHRRRGRRGAAADGEGAQAA